MHHDPLAAVLPAALFTLLLALVTALIGVIFDSY
jgi:hypothetical protein